MNRMEHEEDIIRRIRQGDIREFESLFRSSYASLVRYAKTIVMDHDTAEEIVQDFFFRMWQDREKINISNSINGYLFRSVHNRCLHLIDHRKVVERHESEIIASTNEYSEQVTDTIYYNELQARVARVLEKLPARCSTIFSMNRFEGLKYSEIAEKLSVSVKTVEINIGKALKEFRKALAE
jgi:RNA polymerase sigma-70 factor, ECF subfamily